jgi:hypothetical protein
MASSKSSLGRLLPVIGGAFLVAGAAQSFYFASLAERYDSPELAFGGVVAALGTFIVGVIILTLGSMVVQLQKQVGELVSINASNTEHTSLLEQQVRQNAEMLDVQRRQVAWLERMAPEQVVREPAASDLGTASAADTADVVAQHG